MSQDVLAEQLEVSRQAVSKWERDEAVPETDKIVRIAQLFGVTTDYLLRDDQPQQPPAQPAYGGPRPGSTTMRIERFIRRHGYKVGYALIAWGAVLCAIALLVMILMPSFGSGIFDMAADDHGFGNSVSGGIVEGVDLPKDVLDEIFNQNGAGMGDDLFDSYQQDVQQMQSVWQGQMRLMSMMFGIPVMLLGLGLIIFGIIVVKKGKEIARKTME